MQAAPLLAAIGIQTWVAKSVLPGAKITENFAVMRLHNSQKELVGYLLVDTSAHLLLQEIAVRRLTQAMLTAIKLTAENVAMPLADLEQQKILIFGKELAVNIQNKMTPSVCIAIHHPAELLQQPNLKRAAWQDLQKFISP